jgi:hypothetical protein
VTIGYEPKAVQGTQGSESTFALIITVLKDRQVEWGKFCFEYTEVKDSQDSLKLNV